MMRMVTLAAALAAAPTGQGQGCAGDLYCRVAALEFRANADGQMIQSLMEVAERNAEQVGHLKAALVLLEQRVAALERREPSSGSSLIGLGGLERGGGFLHGALAHAHDPRRLGLTDGRAVPFAGW